METSDRVGKPYLGVHKTGSRPRGGYAGGSAALRDAARFELLLSRAPRIASIASLRLGRHLTELADGCFFVDFQPENTKTRRWLSYPLDGVASQVFRDYLHQGRPCLPGAAGNDFLWLGTRGRPLGTGGLGKIVRRRTQVWFGKAVGPHVARKWLRLSAGLADRLFAASEEFALMGDEEPCV